MRLKPGKKSKPIIWEEQLSLNVPAVYSHLGSVNMEERPSRDDTSLNSQNDDYEATNAIEADGVLDDKLLDAVTPRISVLDESVEDEDHPVKRTFCTRCRTISSSFLSTSYVSGSDNLPGIERLQQSRNSQTRFLGDQGHPASAGDSFEDSDDVPLLRVSHFGVRRTRTLYCVCL